MLATRLGMPPAVVQGVALAFERWDGTGAMYGAGGVDPPVGVRIMTLCNEIEVHFRLGGADAAGRMAAERCDGSGYHRGVGRASLSPAARLLAAAHAHVVARQPRPYRRGLDEEAAGAALRILAEEDRLETRAVDAVMVAAGDRGPQVRRRWPAGLTDREVDVLRQVAIGRSMQEAGSENGHLGGDRGLPLAERLRQDRGGEPGPPPHCSPSSPS